MFFNEHIEAQNLYEMDEDLLKRAIGHDVKLDESNVTLENQGAYYKVGQKTIKKVKHRNKRGIVSDRNWLAITSSQ